MSTPRYQHIRFYKLDITEDFFHGKFRYTKSSHFTGHAVLFGELVVVMPWTKVRSARPFGKVKQSPPIYFVGFQELSGKGPTVDVRPPQKRDGGDRTPEAIGGNEKCPSA